MNNIILYNYFRSSTSYRVRIVLHHKEIPFEYKAVHLLEGGGQQHKQDYLAINPIAEVPSLVHNDKVIAQSFAIIEYLEEVFPQHSIFPKDLHTKAVVRQFCENINSSAHPYQNLKTLQYLEKHAGFTDSQKSAWVSNWASLAFAATERLLEKHSGQFCFGDQVTAADVFLVPQVFSAKRFNVDLTSFSKVVQISENAERLDAFQKAHPNNQPDTPK